MKNYILDTNVILHDAQAIFKFDENAVVLPMTVIEELDTFKKELSDTGRNARKFARDLEEIRGSQSLNSPIQINNAGGTVQVVTVASHILSGMPSDLNHHLADNQILAVAFQFLLESKHPTILVSNDTNVRLKAAALGIPAEAYKNTRVNAEEFYTGILEVHSVEDIPSLDYLLPNQIVVVRDPVTDVITFEGRVDKGSNSIMPLRDKIGAWGLSPANDEQRYAMELLLNDDIKLVTLSGIAGTGKSLIATACALGQVTDDFKYRKLLISRPVMPLGKDIGFLPGTAREKLDPYMAPIYDVVEFLVSGGHADLTVKPTKKGKHCKLDDEKELGRLGKGLLELEAVGILEVEALLYIRGRSIPNVFMLVDESQNLTPHEVKTIVSRVGQGTKLVFTGDVEQVDTPYLDAESNGLSYLIEKFKDQSIAAHITLTKGERSELAEIATQIL